MKKNKPHISNTIFRKYINEGTRRMSIAHEAPICILDIVKEHTDYDYCLIHLIEESKEYKDYFYNNTAVRNNSYFNSINARIRPIILDHSVFELGEAFESTKYEFYIRDLNPDIYIMPDVLGNKEATLDNAKEWNEKEFERYSMAVVQGQSMDELVECYQEFLELDIDAIAIGFNHNFMINDESTRDWDQANGRIRLIKYLKEKKIWDNTKYHHLLGCSLPLEFAHPVYHNSINSVDTSSPVLHGLLDIDYDEFGMLEKRKIKVNELMYSTVYPEQIEKIVDNIKKFSYICA